MVATPIISPNYKEKNLGTVTISASALRTLANTIQKKYHTKNDIQIEVYMITFFKKAVTTIGFELKHEKGKIRWLSKSL